MSVKAHTEYTYEMDDHTFPLPFDPEGDAEFTWVSDDGKRAVLAFLVHDDSPADPFEEFDEGDFYQFDGQYDHYSARPDMDEFKRVVRSNPGRVVTVKSCGEGFQVDAGPFSVRDTRFDPKGNRAGDSGRSISDDAIDDADGYYIAPEDVADPARYAKGALEQYSDWCEGDVYGVIVWTYERADVGDGWDDPDRDNEVWGFYGYDYARGELKEQFDAAVKGGISHGR